MFKGESLNIYNESGPCIPVVEGVSIDNNWKYAVKEQLLTVVPKDDHGQTFTVAVSVLNLPDYFPYLTEEDTRAHIFSAAESLNRQYILPREVIDIVANYDQKIAHPSVTFAWDIDTHNDSIDNVRFFESVAINSQVINNSNADIVHRQDGSIDFDELARISRSIERAFYVPLLPEKRRKLVDADAWVTSKANGSIWVIHKAVNYLIADELKHAQIPLLYKAKYSSLVSVNGNRIDNPELISQLSLEAHPVEESIVFAHKPETLTSSLRVTAPVRKPEAFVNLANIVCYLRGEEPLFSQEYIESLATLINRRNAHKKKRKYRRVMRYFSPEYMDGNANLGSIDDITFATMLRVAQTEEIVNIAFVDEIERRLADGVLGQHVSSAILADTAWMSSQMESIVGPYEINSTSLVDMRKTPSIDLIELYIQSIRKDPSGLILSELCNRGESRHLHPMILQVISDFIPEKWSEYRKVIDSLVDSERSENQEISCKVVNDLRKQGTVQEINQYFQIILRQNRWDEHVHQLFIDTLSQNSLSSESAVSLLFSDLVVLFSSDQVRQLESLILPDIEIAHMMEKLGIISMHTKDNKIYYGINGQEIRADGTKLTRVNKFARKYVEKRSRQITELVSNLQVL